MYAIINTPCIVELACNLPFSNKEDINKKLNNGTFSICSK
jgi:hypothetical protein